MSPVVLLHEHPTWSQPVLDGLRRRGVDVAAIDVGQPRALAALEPTPGPVARWINRVNAMPSTGRPPSVVAATGQLLLGLELRGETVVNGHRTWALGASKAAQVELFDHLGLGAPATVTITAPAEAPAAAERLGYPVLIKPNVGGSGHGIARFDDVGGLERAIAADQVDLGVDGTGVVQEVIDPADGLVHRVEILGTDLFYATDQLAQAGVFNYCAADGCAVDHIALVTPPDDIVDAAAAVMVAAGADVGGVEYLIDRRTGRPVFFDFNPYSNFVSGRDDELGFDPVDRYLDHVLAVT